MVINPIGSNQTEVSTSKYLILFSYKTPVAFKDCDSSTIYVTNKKHSTTTSKHINKWLKNTSHILVETVDQTIVDGVMEDKRMKK
jgi:hypothetical protein